MDGRSLKLLHASLSPEILKTGMWSLRSFEQPQFWLLVKCSGGYRQNVPIPAPSILNVTALTRISLSFHFTFAEVFKCIPLSEPETPYL